MAVGKGKADPLIGEMDAFARQLLESVKSDTATAQAKLDTFKTITAWVQVRNRLADDAEGGDLDAIRSKLRADDDVEGAADQRKTRGRKPAALPGGKGGSALDAIRKRLPRADDDDPGSNSQGLEF